MQIEEIKQLVSQHRTARVLHAALLHNLFDAVEDGKTSEDIANKAKTDERATEMVLNALVSLGLLEKMDDRYYHTEVSKDYLRSDSPHSRVAGLRHSAQSWERWTDLPSIMKTGRLPERTSTFDDPDRYRTFILAMHEYQLPHAREVVAAFSMESGASILDCGGGPGTYARAFAREYPESKVTLFDLPDAINIAQELDSGPANLNYLSGNFFQDDLGGPYDLIFLSNIIHSWAADENKELFTRLTSVLKPGGFLIVRDRFLQENGVEPRGAVLFSLHMLVSNLRGQSYTISQVKSWMETVGLEPGPYRQIGDHTELVMGSKP